MLLLDPHQDGTKPGRRWNHGTWWYFVGNWVVLPCVYTSPIFLGEFWSRGQTILAGISLFVEVARHSQYHGFHSCVLRREHFVKTHLHRVYLRCHSFSHYYTQDFMNVGKHEDRNTGWFKNWHLCGVSKLLFYDHGTMKPTQYFTDPCYLSPCCAFDHSWIPLRSTRTSWPATVHFRSLAGRTDLVFLDRQSTSGLFRADFHSSIFARRCKPIKCMLNTLFRRCKQRQTVCTT